MWLLASTTSLIAFSFGAVLVSFFLIRHSRRYFDNQKKRTGDLAGIAEKTRHTSLSHSGARPVDSAAWQVQMHETARNLIGEIDSKMRALQVLIQMADEATARLESALRQTHELGGGQALQSSILGESGLSTTVPAHPPSIEDGSD